MQLKKILVISYDNPVDFDNKVEKLGFSLIPFVNRKKVFLVYIDKRLENSVKRLADSIPPKNPRIQCFESDPKNFQLLNTSTEILESAFEFLVEILVLIVPCDTYEELANAVCEQLHDNVTMFSSQEKNSSKNFFLYDTKTREKESVRI